MAKQFSKWCFLPFLAASQLVDAGGLWLNEYGSPAMGRARAGAQAGVNDASTVLHNPATMSRLDSKQWMAAGTLIYSEVEFDLERTLPNLNGTNEGKDAGGLAPGASAFYVNPNFNDKWSWGFSVAGLAGAALDYTDSWAGRFQATEVELVTIGFMPGVSYQLNDWLSVGIGPQLVYAELLVDLAVPRIGLPDAKAEIDGDDTEFGYKLGLAAELSDKTRLGITYQSELDFEFSGDFKLSAAGVDVGVDSELPLAAFVRIGLTHQLTEDIGLHATWGWDDWSTLDNVNLSTNTAGAVIKADWDDTYHYAAGIDYKTSPNWTLTTGISYDTNPISKHNRNAQLPVDRQIRYAFGAQYEYGKQFSMGGQLVYGDMGKASIEGIGYGGEFKTNQVFFFSINANWLL
jgi:long-chain fatty acid transport protein